MESWKLVWRNGLEPLLSTHSLEVLRDALVIDDSRLIQGATTTPAPLQCLQDWPMEAGDFIAFMGWHGEGLDTVGECEEFFARMAHAVDERLGEPAGIRWILNWFDETPREEMRRLLLAEVQRSLVLRSQQVPA